MTIKLNKYIKSNHLQYGMHGIMGKSVFQTIKRQMQTFKLVYHLSLMCVQNNWCYISVPVHLLSLTLFWYLPSWHFCQHQVYHSSCCKTLLCTISFLSLDNSLTCIEKIPNAVRIGWWCQTRFSKLAIIVQGTCRQNFRLQQI